MIYKLKHGDTFKVLPIIMKDNTFNSHISILSAFLFKKMIYECNDGYLNDFISLDYDRGLPSDFRISRRINHFYYIYINNKIETIIVGSQLKKIIDSVDTLELANGCIRDNKHIQVSIEPIRVSNGDVYSNYDKSIVIDRNWEKPVKNINNQIEWRDWIKKNKPDFVEDYIEQRNIINNLIFLRNNLGNNSFLSEIISIEREKKLNKILTKDNFLNI